MSAPQSHRPGRRMMILAFVIGGLFMAFGAKSALGDARDAHPFALAVHLVGFDLAHDAVFAPLIFIVSYLLGRVVPSIARGPVRAAFAASLLFATFAYPLVRRWGRRAGNSSTLPLAYGTNLAIVLGIVWLIAAAVIVRRYRNSRP
jgi:hypothetical protein